MLEFLLSIVLLTKKLFLLWIVFTFKGKPRELLSEMEKEAFGKWDKHS